MATAQTLSRSATHVNPDGTVADYKPVIVDPLSVTPTKDNVSCYWNPNQTGALSFGNLRFVKDTEVDDLASDVGLTCKLQTDRKIVISSGPMVNMFAVSKASKRGWWRHCMSFVFFVHKRRSALISGGSNLLRAAANCLHTLTLSLACL